MAREAFFLGRGLASALGTDLEAALHRLPDGVEPQSLPVAPDCEWPYFAIPEESADWHARARRIVCGVVAECGAALDREAPLLVASSSLNVGALEGGAPFLPDCHTFVEELAAWLDWRGPVYWVSTACTSSLNALLSARAMIRSGAANHALVLGLELRNRFSGAGFGAMQLLDTRPPRPLAVDRGGLVLGEAVAALYLGHEPGRWRLCGGANVIDGSNPAGATRAAVSRMVREALADSGLAGGDIDLVKLQAAGSPHNDAEEIHGLRAVFGRRLPPLATLKTCLGHTLGASGAAELALLTAALESGVWPRLPAVEVDPALGVTCVDETLQARMILANILGFGGGHAAVVVEDTFRSPA